MSATCPDCEYARLERAGIHMTHGGLSADAADALAQGERCATHRSQEKILDAVEGSTEYRPTSGLKIAVVRWEKFAKQKGEFVGGERTLAGPYRFGFDGSREVVLELYRKWLWAEIQGRSMVVGKLNSLLAQARTKEGLVLVCVEPELGEVIARALRWLESTEANKGNEGRKDSAA